MPKILKNIPLLFLCISTPLLSSEISGVWRSEPGDSGGYVHVDIQKCEDHVCGTIVRAINEHGQENRRYEHLGQKMIWDMSPDGPDRWSGGEIWSPDRDKTYRSKMTLSGDQLSVSGCVLFICRSQVWQRVN